MMKRLQKYFISGLIVLIPFILTIYFLILIINFADGLLGKYLEPYFDAKFGFYFRGLSILIGAYIVILIGFFTTNILGKRLFTKLEEVILKLPFFRQVYPALKEIAMFLFSHDQIRSFKQVVVVQYPRIGLFSIGFLTNDSPVQLSDKVGQEMCNVFIPTVPNPVTGFLILVPKKDIIFTNLRVEETVKMFVSGGVLNPL